MRRARAKAMWCMKWKCQSRRFPPSAPARGCHRPRSRSIGVKKATFSNWEQGRRWPDGPGRVLLALIAKEPGIVQRVLSK